MNVHYVELTGDIGMQKKTLQGNLVQNKKTLNGNLERYVVTSVKWGQITGNVYEQTDLFSALSVIDCGTSTEVI